VTGLTADSLDIGSRQVILGHNELLEVDVRGERHSGCVKLEDVSLGLGVGKREF
jgi:hypothetical protein